MQTSSPLVLAAGFTMAVVSPALAGPPTSAGKLTDLRVERESAGPVVAPRGQQFPLGSFVTMRDELENFPVDTSFDGTGVSAEATSFTGPDGFVWPMNNLRGIADPPQASGWVRIVDLSSGPVGGPNGVVNASKALRIKTIAAQAPGQFFLGARFRFGGDKQGASPLSLEPLPGVNTRVSAEHFVSSIDTRYTFEPISGISGFIAGRAVWGGTCNNLDCQDDGFPLGTIEHIYLLYVPPASFPTQIFYPATYCHSFDNGVIPDCIPHPGFQTGDLVPPPIANWFRLAGETTADGRFQLHLDLLDGSQEAAIWESLILTSGILDRIGWNASFEAQGEFMLVDNIEASGTIYEPPPPPPLTCPYLDDAEWLDLLPLIGQPGRWDASATSYASVLRYGIHGQVISQTNILSNNHYRREMSTELLASSATVSNDIVVSVQALRTGATVRGFGLVDGDGLAARVFLGREDRLDTENPYYEPSVYVQINPDYDPVDDPSGDPDDNIPEVGLDVADTNHDWTTGDFRVLQLRLSANGALRVSIDGQRIYAGAGAFTSSIDRFVFESENNTFGEGSTLRIDDVTLACDAPSCAADFDFDDAVTFADLNAVLSNFGATNLTGFNPGDADADGVVNFADLNAVLAAFGTSCE
jgi:hypothetical protein